MQTMIQRRALFGLVLAGLLATLEIVWEPWHVTSDHHFEDADVAGHADDRGAHSHPGDHDEEEHEHHSVVEHEQSLVAGRSHAPLVVVHAVVLVAPVPADPPVVSRRPPDTPAHAVNESPPDRRLSQRGPPRA
jgi:hypothetical protein